jgi:hypothetical protein
MQSPNNSGYFLLWSYKHKCAIYRRLEKHDIYFKDQNWRGKWQKLQTDESGKYLIFEKEKFYLIFDIWQQQELQQEEEQQRRANVRQQKKVYLQRQK